MKHISNIKTFTFIFTIFFCTFNSAHANQINFSSDFSAPFFLPGALNSEISNVQGTLQLPNLLKDINPDLDRGEFNGLLDAESYITIDGTTSSLNGLDFNLRIFDQSGCDCFFLEVLWAETIAGISFDSLFFNLQSESGGLFEGTNLEALDGFNQNDIPFLFSNTWSFRTNSSGSPVGRNFLTEFNIQGQNLNVQDVNAPKVTLISFLILLLVSYRGLVVRHHRL